MVVVEEEAKGLIELTAETDVVLGLVWFGFWIWFWF